MITLYGINIVVIIGIEHERNGPLNECEPTRHNRADSSLLNLFLCYILYFNSVLCYF